MKNPRKQTPARKYGLLWRLMADDALSPPAKLVAVALLLKFHNAKTARCNPSIASIARTAGISRRAVFYAIAELKDAGWIAVESTSGGSPNHTNQYSFDFKGAKSTASQTGAQDAPPTGAQDARVHEMHPTGAQFAHEPLKTTRPSGGGWEGDISSQRAPDGALVREEEFEKLRQLWKRPWGMNVAKALAAFNRVIASGKVAPADILDKARRWVAAQEPRFLSPLETWLDDGAWQNDPPTQLNGKYHKPSAAEVAANLAREAQRNRR